MGPGRVHVWRLRLDVDDARFDDLSSKFAKAGCRVLASDELKRASRFHFDKDRVRFTRCRTVLRLLLARYLEVEPADIRFTYSPRDKPEVAADQNPRNLRFNVSHSADMALIAVGVQDSLGVDIERVRLDVNTAELSERFFSARERENLRPIPEKLRVAAFYAVWTRKEAFLKATGEGLGFPLSHFSVSVHPEVEPRIEEIGGDTNTAKRWSLLDVLAADGFRSAVAIERPNVTIATFDLSV